jgi:hypothetical protein
VRQDRDPDSYPSAKGRRPFKGKGWLGVSYRKSRDGYGDCSSDHANSYGALAAASPSTSECWHALLPDGPACRKRLQMIYSIVRYRMRIEPRETSEYRAQRNQGSFLSWPEVPQVQDERREATLIGKALQANSLLESRACCSWSVRENKLLVPALFSSSPASVFGSPGTDRMEYSQVVRHRFLVPACKGSNPFTPDYDNRICQERADNYRGSGSG